MAREIAALFELELRPPPGAPELELDPAVRTPSTPVRGRRPAAASLNAPDGNRCSGTYRGKESFRGLQFTNLLSQILISSFPLVERPTGYELTRITQLRT